MLLKGCWAGLYPALFHYFSCAGQHAVMAVTGAQIQPHSLLRPALRSCAALLLFATLLHGWSPFALRVRIESLASDEASRLIPSKAVNAQAIYGTAEPVPFVKSPFPFV